MHINLKTGLCEQAVFLPSPNFDQRPPECEVDVVVLHSISLPPGEYQTPVDIAQHPVSRFFTNCLDTQEHPFYQQIDGVKVSAHFFILRSGQLVQFVRITDRAWHAGESYCLQTSGVNNNSIGIELEGFDEADDGYTEYQYACLTRLLRALKSAIPQIANNLFAHSDIAPDRKTDPGPEFDWAKLGSIMT